MISLFLWGSLLYHANLIAHALPHVDDTLAHYDTIPSLKKQDWDGADITIQYKNRSLPIKLWKNDLIEGNDTETTHVYLSGKVTGIPGSYVRMNAFDDSVEGIISLGPRGLLRIDLAKRYEGVHQDANMIVYHQEDLKSLEKRDAFSDPIKESKRFWELLDNHLYARSLRCKSKMPLASKYAVPTTGQKAEVDQTRQQPRPAPQQPQRPVARPQPQPVPQQPRQMPVAHRPTTRPAAPAPKLTRCNAGLIADYSFYLQHKNEPGGIQNYMASLFNEVSGHIYSQIGVSLGIKYMYVVTNPNDRTGLGRNFGNPTSSVWYINNRSSKLPGFNADDLCVVHILSSAKFQQGAVGVAFIGTVCSSGANAGISSDNYGKLSRTDYTSVMMHEVGHNFGSQHDSFMQRGLVCAPMTNRYVMYPSVQSGSANGHRFSPCSLASIQKTLANPRKRCWNSQGIRAPVRSNGKNEIAQMVVDQF